MTELADDIATLLNYFGIPKAHAVIGISQGGAAALQFALRHPERTKHIIACDTQEKSPPVDIVSKEEIEKAKRDGMGALAAEMAARWFSPASPLHPLSGTPESKAVLEMISATPVLGFEAGASSLRDYDLVADGLLQSKVKTLLVAGENDVPLFNWLKLLKFEWLMAGGQVKFAPVSGSGHLPILDGADKWLEAVIEFLE
jgi:pimeloyl-ACP methyl ester carboxylesterase